MNSEWSKNGSRGNGFDPTENVVSRAVELGYNVIEDQLKQGQKVAEQLANGNIDATQVDGNMSEVAERIVRFYSDMGALWAEMVESVLRNPAMRDVFPDAAQRSSGQPQSSPTETKAPAARTRAEMLVEINSPVPTGARVSVDLGSDEDVSAMTLQPLHARDPGKPPMSDVQLVCPDDGWPPTVRVTIPKGQPPGTYSGVILASATDEPVGTVCVRIPQPSLGSRD